MSFSQTWSSSPSSPKDLTLLGKKSNVDKDAIENRNKDIKIAICGGGISGMALALALVEAGFHDIDVYESVREIQEVGVGINIQPHGVRELIEMGLASELERIAIPTGKIQYYHENGQFIFEDPRGMNAGYNWPQYSIHRGKLLGILHNAVTERLGKHRIHTGHKVISCGSCNENGAWATFELRDQHQSKDHSKLLPRKKTVQASIVIGCDGIHSKVRECFVDSSPPRWTGITMLRGLTRMKPFLDGRTMTIIGPIQKEMVIYPISKETEEEEGDMALVNWVALMQAEDDNDDGDSSSRMLEKWNQEVENLEHAMKPFKDFKYDFLDVPTMIQSAEKVYQYPMIDREPLDRWVFGNVALMGDAAHPMIPIGANGGTQTIIDARVLAVELARHHDVPSALKAYENQRKEAVNRIVKANREESETRFMEEIHEKCPDGFDRLDDHITEEELQNISNVYKSVAGFDPIMLNQRESYSLSPSKWPHLDMVVKNATDCP